MCTVLFQPVSSVKGTMPVNVPPQCLLLSSIPTLELAHYFFLSLADLPSPSSILIFSQRPQVPHLQIQLFSLPLPKP